MQQQRQQYPAMCYPPVTAMPAQSCWLKLLLPELLPPAVQHALYLHCDMLVKRGPSRLLREAHNTFEVRALTHTLRSGAACDVVTNRHCWAGPDTEAQAAVTRLAVV